MIFTERKPIIAINTRHWIPNKMEGIGRFAMNIAIELCCQHPKAEFHWFFDRKPQIEFSLPKNVKTHVLYPPARTIKLIKFWNNVSVPYVLKKISADIYISPDNMNSLKAPCPTISVIHDINFEHFPYDLPAKISEFYHKYTPAFIDKAIHVITVSNFSKTDIIQHYNVSPEKISIIHNGVAGHFKPLNSQLISDTRFRYSNGKPYFFVLGSIHPRKNLIKTIESYTAFRNKTNNDFPLVISGRELFSNKNIGLFLKNNPYKNDISFTGYLDDKTLANVLGSAFSLLYLSVFEGFGVPIIEAFASNVPVIASNVSSIPEVASDAALLVSPHDTKSIVEAMNKLVFDDKARTQLCEKGLRQANLYKWEKNAEKFWEIIKKYISN